MIYANPKFHLLYAALAALVLFYARSLKRRRRMAESFAEKGILENIASTLSRKRIIFKASLLTLAVLSACFSLMRPQWGFKWEEVKRRGLDILIAVDTSKSMLARDIKPNRLQRAKLAVKDMVGKLKSDRVGLIAFSGSSFLQAPLTTDYGGLLLALDDLDVYTIPRPGTNITVAIREAIKVLKGADRDFKVLVIITDGEDLEGDPLRASQEAQKEGLKIFCVGAGTPDGELIPVMNEQGARAFLKDKSGAIVKSRLNEDSLKKIALNTGGAYIRATGADFGLGALYDQKISKLEKRELESKMKKQYTERFQIFLAIALVILFVDPFIGERRERE